MLINQLHIKTEITTQITLDCSRADAIVTRLQQFPTDGSIQSSTIYRPFLCRISGCNSNNKFPENHQKFCSILHIIIGSGSLIIKFIRSGIKAHERGLTIYI